MLVCFKPFIPLSLSSQHSHNSVEVCASLLDHRLTLLFHFFFYAKETDPQVVTVPLGQGSAPFNPRSQLLPASPSACVSVPNGTFKSGKTSRTCILSLQVSVPYRIHSKGPKKKRKKSTVGAQSDLGEAENGMDLDTPCSTGNFHYKAGFV